MKNEESRIKQDFLIAIFLFLGALISRFVFLGLRPFDGDEGVVIKMAQAADFSELIKAVSNDVHPPLYHFLEFVNLKALPLNEFNARALSAFCGALTCVAVYFVFKKLLGRKTAVMTAVLSVFSATLAYHSAEVRPYSLLALIFFVQFYFFLGILDGKKKLYPLIFTLFTLFLVFTQYIGFILVFGEILYLLIFKRESFWRAFFASFAAVIFFFLLWGKEFVAQVIGRSGEQSQALNLKANIVGLANALYRFGAGRLFLDLDPSISKNLAFLKDSPILFAVFVVSLFLPVALFIFGAVKLYLKKREIFYFLLVVFLPLVLAALATAEIGPRSVRYFSFLAPVYLAAVVYGFNTSKKSAIKYVVWAVFLVIFASAFINQIYFERLKPGVNEIAEFLKVNAATGDSLVIQGGYGGGEELVARYYLKNAQKKLKIYDLYGDYQTGNLDEIKSRRAIDYIFLSRSESASVWFYDFTYSFDESALAGNFKKASLGFDKENRPLVLYKITRDPSPAAQDDKGGISK